MLFNSYEFIFLFLPITLIIYFLLNKYEKYNLAKGWLVLASLYFYSYFHKSYLILILLSIVVNYFIGDRLNIENETIKRKLLLILGSVFNIGALGYFKYYDFFIENINYIFRINIPLLDILLPLGISFFTFQQLSFVIDSYYRKNLRYDFLSYSLFVTFFPQLIAGPIVLPTEMLPQFENLENKKINWENMNRGLYIFSIGLAKKVIIADTIGVYANVGFDVMKSLSFVESWLTSLAYTIQLYFDFSGYCDMAIGIGLMFNIVLPINFNSPYKSTNIQEFWKKWHMTLGRFLTNYLYIPLGGNRRGEKRTLLNLLIVFLVSGIWHGAGWNFIIWGMLHGVCILIHRVWKNSGRKLNKFVGWFITMNLVNIFWVFFRAKNLKGAFKVIEGMFNFSSIGNGDMSRFLYAVNERTNGIGVDENTIIFPLAIIIIFLGKNSIFKCENFKISKISTLEINLYFILSILYLMRVSTFLYFNF
ncbi:MBOAT family O-acyltransferase [Fusobacterium sp.]|uniref:MBOAT family O-acyltransferase n=1 Tax=Fusobacterium sp. TaxID=68766 RepID=UPI0026105F46|nr:MBOAT family O-acyltransferase [Fusobacterium sp.]